MPATAETDRTKTLVFFGVLCFFLVVLVRPCQYKYIKGLLISGGGGNAGNSVEVFVPSRDEHCELPDLPGEGRRYHTMEKMTACGGREETATSCITLTDGTWETTTATLLRQR